jgi:hypothetical protein
MLTLGLNDRAVGDPPGRRRSIEIHEVVATTGAAQASRISACRVQPWWRCLRVHAATGIECTAT